MGDEPQQGTGNEARQQRRRNPKGQAKSNPRKNVGGSESEQKVDTGTNQAKEHEPKTETQFERNEAKENAPQDSDAKEKSSKEDGRNGTSVKNRHRKRFQHKKTQRRTEIDAVKASEKLKVFQIEPELFQLLLIPSDPDFPFPIPVLSFDLHISRHYPNQGPPPYIEVKNEEIPVGNRANIQNGFAKYTGSLLDRVDALDKNLEALLSMRAASVVTIVRPTKRDALPGNKTGIVVRPDLANPDNADKKEPNEAEEEAQEIKEGVSKLKLLNDDENKDENDDDEEDEPDIGFYKSSSEESSSEESSSEEEDLPTSGSNVGPKREGTEIQFPDIEMIGISICEVVSLNIVFQCGRCKAAHTFQNLQSAEYGKPSKPRAELCGKCDMPLMVAFRKQYLHSHCNIAGYLDVENGKAIDLLPSTYLATCAECNSVAPPFKNMDLGAKRMAICRNCHTKMFLKIELFDFLLLSTQTLSSEAKSASKVAVGPTAAKQRLNLTGGEPLPNFGACSHYRKSTRWFRFTCCKRVFACDRCHDEEMRHPCELASRMICGYCSREQRFSSKCHYCSHDYTQRTSRFWEGGKGVRDRALMSNKDKRKHKRVNPENAQKQEVHFQGKSKPIKH